MLRQAEAYSEAARRPALEMHLYVGAAHTLVVGANCHTEAANKPALETG